MRRTRLALAAVVVLAVLAVLAVRDAGRFLVVADPLPSHADAIVMLGGSLSDRVLETARLYRAGVAPIVVLTRERLRRGAPALRGHGVRLPEEHELAARALGQLGVPADAIRLVSRRAASTRAEARAIARWVCRRGLRHVVVVTSPTHTRRARLILAQALGPRVHLTVRPAPAAFFPAEHWWRQRRAIKDVLIEYQKLVVYWLVERWTIEPCGGLERSRAAARSALPPDGLAEQRGELAFRMQLADDVTATDELSRHEQLGNGGPARVGLDPFSLLGLGEDVDRLERHADLVEHLDRGGREAAHREAGRALHVHDDGVLLHLSIDLGQHVAHRALSPSAVVRSCKA
jgi:uncharacterized SAM-binding protein YcdF (DUF218 family)